MTNWSASLVRQAFGPTQVNEEHPEEGNRLMRSYYIESSLCDPDMTTELLMEIQSINIRIYKCEISGLQINNDSELQNLVNSANNGKHRTKIKK